MLDRHVVSVVPVLPRRVKSNRKRGPRKQGQQGVEPWPLSEINHYVDGNRTNPTKSGGETNYRQLDYLIYSIEHARNFDIAWPSEKDHGSVRKRRAEIGNCCADKHCVP